MINDDYQETSNTDNNSEQSEDEPNENIKPPAYEIIDESYKPQIKDKTIIQE